MDSGNDAVAPVTSNQLQLLKDGLVCRSTDSLVALRVCGEAKQDCGTERAQLLASKACVAIRAGTPVQVEASSRSFEWLRVRISADGEALWTERALVLGGQ
ncbi:hypothetical protein [Candidatus Filomicrobium marinum]|nr:hypothetical protein [Candidatus Filomicrobium marinum]